jgi:hypothetical protein
MSQQTQYMSAGSRIFARPCCRGGKLAALQLAGKSDITTAYLIDPVDNTYFTPVGPDYPSAVQALASAAPPRVAGITGVCPADQLISHFWHNVQV